MNPSVNSCLSNSIEQRGRVHRKSALHAIVEEQVVRTPERVAVIYEGADANYRELNARANHWLGICAHSASVQK